MTSPLLRSGLALVFGILISASILAAPTKEQQAEISTISTLLTRAGNLYKQGKNAEAGEAIKEAQAKIEKLGEGGDAQVIKALEAPYKRLLNAHALLEIEGVKLSEIKPLEVKKPMPGGGAGAVPAGAVSFTKQIAPIIVARCGGCHVRNSRGELSMASYEAMMAGNKNGKIVIVGKPEGSIIIDKIEGKEMPPNGAGIPDAEFVTIKKWISEGAKFDGTDAKANLNTLTAGNAAATPMVEIKTATGKETVSFAKDIAPVLASTCVNCHGARRPGGNFSLATFEGLLKGGDSGSPIQSGKGADSFLIKKLRGMASQGQRMPLNLDPLKDDVIAKIEKWIDEGATFDGGDPKQPVVEVAALAKARSSTHEQLSADRAVLAGSNWRLGMSDIGADKLETENFLVLGNVGPNTVKQIGESAEAIAPKVGEMLKAVSGQPLIKGKMTLFVFRERYDYSEFGKMVEQREIPGMWRGHFKFSIVDAYAAVIPPKADDYHLQTLIAQQLAGCYVASLGKGGTPVWFSQGAGRVIASRLDGGDPRVVAWDDAIPEIVSGLPSPDAFLTGKLDPESADIASYSFVKFLMTDGKRFQAVLDKLRGGGDFAKSFQEVYGKTPNALCEMWVLKPPSRSVPAKKTAGKK
ncbi:MAG: c-type cytochrome domain-containing protein [Pirellulaceae bacterium]